ncbi:MAG: PKD domain-containing protein [Bacteroidota bacterium]
MRLELNATLLVKNISPLPAIHKILFRSLISVLIIFNSQLSAQCPDLIDGTGTPSAAPVWVSCAGTDFILFIQSQDTIFDYSIDFGDGSPLMTGDTLLPGSFVSYMFTDTVANFTVTLNDTTSGGTPCVLTGTVIMEITPSASIQIPVGSPTYGCAPAAYAFENATTNVSQNTVFTWNFGDGSPVEVYGDTNLGDTIYHTYLPGTVNCDVTVNLTAQNNCPPISTNTYYPIQVWDYDDAQITASPVLLCYPDTIVHFDNTTNMNCLVTGNTSQRYEYWNFGDYWGLGYDSIIDWQPFNPPARPGYDIGLPGIGTYTIMMIDSSFCGQDTAYTIINIVPQPTAGLSANPDTICEGQDIVFTNQSAGANSYDWNFGDGSGWMTTGSSGNQTHTYTVAGNYTVYLVANITGGTASCTDTASVDVVVLPGPQAIFSADVVEGCDSLSVTFSDSSIDAVSWFWDFDNGDTNNIQNPPVQQYDTTGTFIATLTVISANGCTDSQQVTINVFPTPVVNFSAPAVCVNEITLFTDLSTVAGDSIISWFWDFGDGNTDSVKNPTNVYTSPGIYDVALTVSTNNCSATDTIPAIADTLPSASFTSDVTNGCTPLDVVFTNTSTGAISYLWYFGDGDSTSAVDTNHTFINTSSSDTTYVVLLIVKTASGCMDTAVQNITVYPEPVASFTSDAVPACSPVNVNFTNTSSGAASYFWDFGDGTIDTVNVNPSHTFINSTVFIANDTVTLISVSVNGCRDTTSQIVTVYPSANSVIAIPDTGCSPIPVYFNSTLPGAVLFQWDFGDGYTDSVQNPTHTFVNPSNNNDTVYTVQLIVTSGFFCVDTSSIDVIVYAKPNALFSRDTAAGCSPLTVTIQDSSIGAMNYYWDFGDGDTSSTSQSTFTHTYMNTTGSSIIFDLTLIVENANSCLDTIIQQVEVYPDVTANFTMSDTTGCNPITLSLTNSSLYADSLFWNFGDGSPIETAQNPSHIFTSTSVTDTVYTITLIALSTNGCSDTMTSQISVYPSPDASFTATPVSQIFPNSTVDIVNSSGPGNWQYLWDFDYGNTDTVQYPVSHTYSTYGDYTIQLVVYSSNCSDTTLQMISIIPPPPVADFDISDTSGCRPLTVTFTNNSLYADSLSWDFGDGGTSTMPNPVYTYYNTGVYSVTLTVTGPGGIDDTSKLGLVAVYEIPTAAFNINPDPALIYLPDKPIYCYNLSVNAGMYIWYFGDGTTSTEENPEHIYTAVGEYDITLIAENEFECIDTLTKYAIVNVEEGGTLVFPTAFTPDPNGPGDGKYDPVSFDNDIFHPLWDGVEEYLLRIFNRWGELIFESNDIDTGWNGYYRSILCKQDVYVWKVKVKFISGETRTMAGDVTLLR